MAPTILLSAGEPSGDLHGAALARALRRRWPDAELYGLGGPLMQEAGVELLAHTDELAVMGFAEVFRHLPYFLRLMRRVRRTLRERRPALVIPIDYPGFNLRLANAARRSGIPVLYYIAPQVWAWHRSRVHGLARAADRLAVILPFEEKLFRAAGANVHFVGHPLLDLAPARLTRAEFCARHGLDPDRPVLALFPGSRRQEVGRHLALFAAAARQVCAERPDVQAIIATSPAVPAEHYRSVALPRATDSWELLHHADTALVKSGTSTLQAALTATPLVVAYRMHDLSYALARRLVRVPHVALVNLVAEARVAPELIQDAATPQALAHELLPRLPGGDHHEEARAALAAVRARLVPPGGAGTAAERVSALAAELIHAA
ncbi:MAG TPA: lipid-A-disaccharide synthase [Longimicrobiales bacterium]|nr:lipid-A-disaccharide synthase [Longimicrobiales bacterium]